MADDISPEEAAAQQKANCIFCKIATGEIPSKKIYEDEQMLAFLDINPAMPGHTLVATKEHYPIMPLIPPNEFQHLFGTTPMLARAIMQGMLSQRCSVFIANGGVAGQQSPHFLFHIMPREDGDGITSLDIPQNGINQSDIAPMIKQNLYSVMREHLTKQNKAHLLQVGTPLQEPPTPIASPQPTQNPAEPSMTFGQLAKILDDNPDIRQVLENDPDRLQSILNENPELKSLFGGIDIRVLSEQLRQITQNNPSTDSNESDDLEQMGPQDNDVEQIQSPDTQQTEYQEPTPDTVQQEESQSDQIIPAAQMTLAQIFDFIEQKPKLKDLILNNPDELKALIQTNDRLRLFFEGVNPESIIQAYRRHMGDTDAL